jgi:hypothetical protein
MSEWLKRAAEGGDSDAETILKSESLRNENKP